ncbi:MAG: hypothetical protein Rpha_1467 [Candidatus Ruthia sp. Apha_13_S6]|nr:hypothetical protein [Candidatus Ruthia sp. Apha_13_S6]
MPSTNEVTVKAPKGDISYEILSVEIFTFYNNSGLYAKCMVSW